MRAAFAAAGTLAATASSLLLVAFAAAQGPVGVPSTFWGTVAVDGAAVPAGTEVRGLIDGRDCTQLGANYRTVAVDGGISSYAIEVVHESQVVGCGAEGRSVTFTVGGITAAQSVPWAFGPTRIDLTVGGGQALPLPTATAAPTLPPAGQTATAAFTPLAGTPPLDDVDPREVLGGGSATGTPGAPAAGRDGNSSSIILPLVITVLAIAGVGAAGGWWLARRGGSRGR